MFIKYTPGGPNGTVGKKHKVEVTRMKIVRTKWCTEPLIKEVQIKYEDGKREWVDGKDFFLNMAENNSTIETQLESW